MKENTRRELLKRLTVMAAAGYVAPKVVHINVALAGHKPGHCSGKGGCTCG